MAISTDSEGSGFPHDPLAAVPGLDLQQIRLSLGINFDTIMTILRRYAETTGEVDGLIRDYLDRGDVESAARRMHSLKGSSATIGMADIAKLASEIEIALKNRRVEEALAMMDVLQVKIAALKQFLAHPEAR